MRTSADSACRAIVLIIELVDFQHYIIKRQLSNDNDRSGISFCGNSVDIVSTGSIGKQCSIGSFGLCSICVQLSQSRKRIFSISSISSFLAVSGGGQLLKHRIRLFRIGSVGPFLIFSSGSFICICAICQLSVALKRLSSSRIFSGASLRLTGHGFGIVSCSSKPVIGQ